MTFFILYLRADTDASREKSMQDTEFSQSEHFFNTKFPYT